MTIENLLMNRLIPHNGTSYKLGEHGYVHAEVKRIALGTNIATVHIDHVRNRLQREKRNAYGER